MNIPYPIYKSNLDKPQKLHGFVSDKKLSCGQLVQVDRSEFEVLQSFEIACYYYPSVNKLTIYAGNQGINTTDRIKRFLNNIGFSEQSAFIKCFFTRCEFEDSRACCRLYYNAFTTLSPFN